MSGENVTMPRGGSWIFGQTSNINIASAYQYYLAAEVHAADYKAIYLINLFKGVCAFVIIMAALISAPYYYATGGSHG